MKPQSKMQTGTLHLPWLKFWIKKKICLMEFILELVLNLLKLSFLIYLEKHVSSCYFVFSLCRFSKIIYKYTEHLASLTYIKHSTREVFLLLFWFLILYLWFSSPTNDDCNWTAEERLFDLCCPTIKYNNVKWCSPRDLKMILYHLNKYAIKLFY